MLEYSHVMPSRLQLSHSGNVSGHLTLRRLQLRHPFLDLVCPFRGMARPLVRGRGLLAVKVFSDDDSAGDGGSRLSFAGSMPADSGGLLVAG